MIKKFFLKTMMKRKGVPEHQQDQVMRMFDKDPKLMTQIAKETQAKVKNEGKSEQIAMMEVAKKYQKELKKLQE